MCKRGLILLCLLLALAAPALGQSALPEGVLSALEPELSLLGSVESFCFPSDQECLVLLRDTNDGLSLYSIVKTGERWLINWGNRHLSLTTKRPVALAPHEERFYTLRTHTPYPPGFALTVTDEATGTPLHSFDFVLRDGRWRLAQHRGGDGVYAEILHSTDSSNRLDMADGDSCAVFWSDERLTDLAGKIAFPNCNSVCADAMALSMLPSVYTGTYFFDLTPRFSMPETGLLSVCLGVNGLKYPVYSGPGTTYHRAANGKASMSSGESFGVLGKTDGWLMVIYGVGEDRARVGYVRYGGDPYLEQVAALTEESDFSHFENVFTTQRLPLWDDPVNRANPLCTLKKNTEVVFLEDCGDLAYVEVRVNGRRMRGFVKADALGNG